MECQGLHIMTTCANVRLHVIVKTMEKDCKKAINLKIHYFLGYYKKLARKFMKQEDLVLLSGNKNINKSCVYY